jgi:hypothetical protein
VGHNDLVVGTVMTRPGTIFPGAAQVQARLGADSKRRVERMCKTPIPRSGRRLCSTCWGIGVDQNDLPCKPCNGSGTLPPEVHGKPPGII